MRDTGYGSQSDRLLAVSTQGRLHVLDGRTGAEIWTSPVAGGYKVAGHPLVIERSGKTVILAPLGGAGIVAYDWQSKAELWRSPAGLPVMSSPAVSGFGSAAKLFVVAAAMRGDVLVLDFDTGQLVWRDGVAGGKTVEGDPVLADLDGDGVDDILIAGHDFKLHALSGRGTLGVLK